MKMLGIIKPFHKMDPLSKHTAFISIGSNIGDKLAHCHDAIRRIKSDGIGLILATSSFYRTDPVDFTDQDWFLNAVLKVETSLAPLALLKGLQQIQTEAGRKSGGIRFGPRIIDLDIIFYDNLVLTHERLVIPHPRMHKRRFVLKPVCDIDPQIVHPGLGQNVGELLKQINDDNQGVYRFPCAF